MSWTRFPSRWRSRRQLSQSSTEIARFPFARAACSMWISDRTIRAVFRRCSRYWLLGKAQEQARQRFRTIEARANLVSPTRKSVERRHNRHGWRRSASELLSRHEWSKSAKVQQSKRSLRRSVERPQNGPGWKRNASKLLSRRE